MATKCARLLRAVRKVLAAYQTFLDTDDLDVLRDALTGLQTAADEHARPAR